MEGRHQRPHRLFVGPLARLAPLAEPCDAHEHHIELGVLRKGRDCALQIGRSIEIVVIEECQQVAPRLEGACILRLGATATADVTDERATRVIRYRRRRLRGVVDDDQIPVLTALSADTCDCLGQ